MKKLARWVAIGAGFALVSLASSARAEPTITLHETIVYGDGARRPLVVVEVPRVPATVAANQAHQSMMQRIEASVHVAPF